MKRLSEPMSAQPRLPALAAAQLGMRCAPASVPSEYEAWRGFRATGSGSLARGGMYQ
jgi:hypothetical protein